MPGEIVLITAPTTPSVTTANAKVHLRVPSSVTVDDGYIDSLVKAAERKVEDLTGYRIMQQTIELRLKDFPCENTLPLEVINVQTGSFSVKYDDTDDSEQTWTSTNYWLNELGRPAVITKKNTVNWPTVIANKPAAVRIRMLAGFATAAEVPADLIHAIKLIVAHWYDNRSPVTEGIVQTEVPKTVEYILDDPLISFKRL
jgi:uncharacterized phiE125 gp8 family phage protein